jgi:hypothetical protein
VIEIRPVVTPHDLRRFIAMPYRLYRDHPAWVPPLRLMESERLNPRKNPFYEHAEVQPFLALEAGSVTGRIAAIDDHQHNEVHRDNLAAFGFFEARREETAQALLATVERWARDRGRSAVRGPLNPSLNDTCGLLVEGFDTAPFMMMPHNPPEYAGFIERAGYAKVKDLFAWIWNFRTERRPGMFELADRLKRRHGIVLRSMNFRRFGEELAAIRTVYCRGWEDNWGFVPPTDREFAHLGTDLKQIADPEFVICAEVGGRLAAFAVALPDINQALAGTNGRLLPRALFRLLNRRRTITQLRLLLLGVLPECRAMGLYPVLLAELQRRAERSRYQRIECSWVLEENRAINGPAEKGGARRYKRYRLYEKPLS